MTASVMYNRTFTRGNWASTVLWGRTRTLNDSDKENSYLLESTLRFAARNYVWTRLENAGRTNELLNGENPLPSGFQEGPLTHVQAYTFGFSRDIPVIDTVDSAISVQFTTYGVGQPLVSAYRSHPAGFTFFLRLRPVGRHEATGW